VKGQLNESVNVELETGDRVVFAELETFMNKRGRIVNSVFGPAEGSTQSRTFATTPKFLYCNITSGIAGAKCDTI